MIILWYPNLQCIRMVIYQAPAQESFEIQLFNLSFSIQSITKSYFNFFQVNKYMEKPPFSYPNPLGSFGGDKRVSKYLKFSLFIVALVGSIK